MEAINHFSSIARCFEYLIPIRWPNGITCPNCNSTEHSFLSTRHIWKCKACKKQFSIKQGTIMEDSPLGYDKWMCAIWLIANAKNGISSYEIHRGIGVTQKSAWFLLHRIRLAMKTGSFVKLSGTIEGDETFVGGKAKNMHKERREAVIKGRGTVGKAIIAGLLERGDKEAGEVSRVAASVVIDRTAETLQSQIRANVEAGSEIMTDEWVGYEGLDADYIHSVINHSVKYAEGNITTNRMENFWTLFKRCINGTYVSVECDHLSAYLDEETFRFNERKGKDGDRFVKVLEGVTGRRITYKELTATDDGLGRRGDMPRMK
ncbi:MAG: IS1595 family transposase [Blastocatellia bacterium]